MTRYPRREHRGRVFSARDLAGRWHMSPQGAEDVMRDIEPYDWPASGRVWSWMQIALIEHASPRLKERRERDE